MEIEFEVASIQIHTILILQRITVALIRSGSAILSDFLPSILSSKIIYLQILG